MQPFPTAPARPADFADDFVGLDPERWVAHYLPHWTTPDRSRARCANDASGVRLLIEADQPDWREEDAPLRVSNLQTGVFSGPVGSARGTHRHRPDLLVRTPTPTRLLWAPTSGRLDVSVSASRDDGCMLAAWLVGTEHLDPRQSGEICLFEIDAAAIAADETRVRCGIKAHGDPALGDDMIEVLLPLDASRPHTWSLQWGPRGTVIGCEGVVIARFAAAPAYPLFLMLDLFEIGPRSTAAAYPKSATLHSVRGWSG
jgi:hypothetical protein